MQSLLDLVTTWASQHGMSISTTKCFSMHIPPSTSMPRQCCLTICSSALPVVLFLHILGVVFNDDLSWSTQHDAVRRKIVSMMGTIQRIGCTLNTDCRKKITQAFVLPHLHNCLSVWGNTSAGPITKMDHALVRAARIILRNRAAELCKETFSSTGISPLANLLTMRNVCSIFHVLNNNMCTYYLGTSQVRDVSVKSTRGSDGRKIVPIRCKRSADELCFQINAVRMWNSLPASITVSHDLSNFRRSINSFLLQ